MQKKIAVSTGPLLAKSGSCVWLLAGEGQRISEDIRDWEMSHESSHWQNPISFQYECKEHSGEKISVRDIPKVSVVVRGQHSRLSSVWGQVPKLDRGGMDTTAARVAAPKCSFHC